MPNVGLGLGLFGIFGIVVAVVAAVLIDSFSDTNNNQHSHSSYKEPSQFSSTFGEGYDTPANSSPSRRKRRGENNDCAICQDAIEGEGNKAILSCKHFFHYNCISRWHKQNKTCPICRR